MVAELDTCKRGGARGLSRTRGPPDFSGGRRILVERSRRAVANTTLLKIRRKDRLHAITSRLDSFMPFNGIIHDR